MDIEVTKERENMYILYDGRVRCFLFVGDTSAVLVDTGFADCDVIGNVRKITDLPLKVVLTHGDGDHTGGVSAVGECYAHKEDWKLLPENVKKNELCDGDIIKVGEFELEVIHIPGHTYGSVAFFERSKHFIITGDGIQKNGMIYMFGDKRNFSLYLESFEKLKGLKENIDKIYPSHGICPIEAEAIDCCHEDAKRLINGEIPMEKRHDFMPCNVYKGNYTGFFYEP